MHLACRTMHVVCRAQFIKAAFSERRRAEIHQMQIERAQADSQAASPKRGGAPLLQLTGAKHSSFLDRMTYNLRERDARLKVSLYCTNHQPPVEGGLWLLSCYCHWVQLRADVQLTYLSDMFRHLDCMPRFRN